MSNSDKKFRTVNRILGTQPNVGPIPGNQVVPWATILLTSWMIGHQMLGLSWLKTGLMALWLMGTWWILTGNQSWRFLAKFIAVPHLARGYARYQSLLTPEPHERKNRKKKAKRRR
jgi:hypothetical protein